MVKRHLSNVIGLLAIGASVIACGNDKGETDGSGPTGSDQQDAQESGGTGGSTAVPASGGVGGAEPAAGAGGAEPAAGAGGTVPEAGAAGTEPAAGAGGTVPEAGAAGTGPVAGAAGPGPVAGAAGAEPAAGAGGTVPEAGAAGTETPPASTCAGDQVPVNGQCVDRKLPDDLGPGWVRIDPGPPTTCIYGEPYSFYVRKGTVNKVMLFLQGGGACWDATTCLLPIYSQTASGPGTSGIMDPNNAQNPFKDWYVVFAPYCSGDVFLGDATQDFGGGPVEFRGFVNMTVVKEWIYENITAPEFLFVSGCSAGAVGVTLHGAYLARAYLDNPEVDGAVVTDSFQGIITDGFTGMVNWNVAANFPDWLPELKSIQAPFPGDTMARGMKEALALPEFSDFVAANFNFANDSVQGLYYGFMGGNAADIGRLISEAVHDISASAPDNYRYYITPGTTHCVFESDGVYNIEVGGVRLIDWLGDLANNVDVQSVE